MPIFEVELKTDDRWNELKKDYEEKRQSAERALNELKQYSATLGHHCFDQITNHVKQDHLKDPSIKKQVCLKKDSAPEDWMYKANITERVAQVHADKTRTPAMRIYSSRTPEPQKSDTIDGAMMAIVLDEDTKLKSLEKLPLVQQVRRTLTNCRDCWPYDCSCYDTGYQGW